MKILTVVGARPQFIKASVVSAEIKRRGGGVKEVLVHTGQHYDDNMSKVFFDELGIKRPDYNLNVGSSSHGAQTGRMLEALEKVMLKEKPDVVLVYGDTNSTLAGALAAKKLGIKIAHVEAGLRSFNVRMPEEINRIVTDRVSDVLFCPTREALGNLAAEGVTEVYARGRLAERITKKAKSFPVSVNSGDVMYDVALNFLRSAEKKSRVMGSLGLTSKDFVLATIHRAENTDDRARLRGIMTALAGISGLMRVVFPVHPRTRAALAACGKGLFGSVETIKPLSYLDMTLLEKNAALIITDSGGVQKEAFFHGTPCVTARDETEWVETVRCGMNVLAGADAGKIMKAASKFLSRRKMRPARKKFYGNGRASRIIVDFLVKAI